MIFRGKVNVMNKVIMINVKIVKKVKFKWKGQGHGHFIHYAYY